MIAAMASVGERAKRRHAESRARAEEDSAR